MARRNNDLGDLYSKEATPDAQASMFFADRKKTKTEPENPLPERNENEKPSTRVRQKKEIKRNKRLNLVLTPEEDKAIREAAESNNLSVNSFIIMVTMKAIRKQQKEEL